MRRYTKELIANWPRCYGQVEMWFNTMIIFLDNVDTPASLALIEEMRAVLETVDFIEWQAEGQKLLQAGEAQARCREYLWSRRPGASDLWSRRRHKPRGYARLTRGLFWKKGAGGCVVMRAGHRKTPRSPRA